MMFGATGSAAPCAQGSSSGPASTACAAPFQLGVVALEQHLTRNSHHQTVVLLGDLISRGHLLDRPEVQRYVDRHHAERDPDGPTSPELVVNWKPSIVILHLDWVEGHCLGRRTLDHRRIWRCDTWHT